MRKLFCILTLCALAGSAWAERIKDLTHLAGVRHNQLVGYGLVVGLDGSGDQTSQTPYTVQSLENMLKQFGITLPPGVTPQTKNIAAVSIHARPVSYTHLTLPTIVRECRSRGSPYH